MTGHQGRGSRAHGGGSVFGPGVVVFLGLAVLTGVEYVIATEMEAVLLPLVAIAVVKAAAIIWYFMRVMRTWRSGEGHTEGETQ